MESGIQGKLPLWGTLFKIPGSEPLLFQYTTNPIERSTNESDLESSVESHRALADSTGDSKSLLLVERLVAAAERSWD